MPIERVQELWKNIIGRNIIGSNSWMNITIQGNVSYFLLFSKTKLQTFEISCE